MTILVVFVSCSKLAEFLHVTFISVEKHCHVTFFRWVALHFRKITYAKKGMPLGNYAMSQKRSKTLAEKLQDIAYYHFRALVNSQLFTALFHA